VLAHVATHLIVAAPIARFLKSAKDLRRQVPLLWRR
jgi:hypothetical protein